MKSHFKAFAVSSLLALFATSAQAQWNLSSGYTQLKDNRNSDTYGVNLGIATVGAGYTFDNDDSAFSWMPEVKIGFGVKDDSYLGNNVEVDTYLAISLRGQYQFDFVYLYAQPVYTKLKTSYVWETYSTSYSESEFGLGTGLGFNANEQLSFELTYEMLAAEKSSNDNKQLVSLGVRYRF